MWTQLADSVLSSGKSTSLPLIKSQVEWNLTRDSIANDKSPHPPPAATEAEDEILLEDEPFVEGPIKCDYGYNVMYSPPSIPHSPKLRKPKK